MKKIIIAISLTLSALTMSIAQSLEVQTQGAEDALLTLTHIDLNNGPNFREIGIEMISPGTGPSADDRDWRIVNRLSGLAFQTALDHTGIFDEVFRMGVSGSNTFSFFQSTVGIGRFPSRALDVQEDSDDLIARFSQTSQGSVGLELVRQSGNVNTTNRDWQILNDDEGIFTIGDSSNGSNYRTQLRLSPTFFSANTHIVPLQDNTFDLGSSSARWDDVYATNPIINTSDIREKKSVTKINYGLETIEKLSPVSYYWKSGDKDKKLGLIAQDVLDIIPEVVNIPEDVEEGLYGISYTELIPVLIQSIQELNDKVENQDIIIKQLASKVGE